MKLKDKVILITGAGQGIGKQISIAYAKEGATVILLGRKVKKLEKVYDEIVELGYPEPIIYQLDLVEATQQNFKDMAFAIKQQLGRLDGILHNATNFYSICELKNQTMEQWQNLLKVNTIVPFAINQACLPLLKDSPDASVILVGESHAGLGNAYWGGFAISKHALENYLKIQTSEWENYSNLRINLVIPGAVNSPQRSKTHPAEDKTLIPQMESLEKDYIFLMSSESKETKGSIIYINQ